MTENPKNINTNKEIENLMSIIDYQINGLHYLYNELSHAIETPDKWKTFNHLIELSHELTKEMNLFRMHIKEIDPHLCNITTKSQKDGKISDET